jgi:parallel beta-helix repeat protein
MKKAILSLSLVLLSNAIFAQLSGPLSGVLPGDSTYSVIGNISVETGDSLIIVAGATLIFNRDIEFDINGYIYAEGAETDSIKFINSPGTTWGGIDFNVTSSDSSRLEYCLITGSSSSGIYCFYSSPAITNCTISGNTTGNDGGGIYC